MWIKVSRIFSWQTIELVILVMLVVNFFNKILLSQKTVKSYMEKCWCKTFECDLNWCCIYKQMIEHIHIPIVSEFNYKLLHNLLGTRSLVCKWDNSIDKFCVSCRDSEESPKHNL